MTTATWTPGKKTSEWISFLLVFAAVVANKRLGLGLELPDIMVLMGGSLGFAAARTMAKREQVRSEVSRQS